MTIVLLLYIAALGTVIGSFLNVCIFRLPLGKSVVRPRSACGACGETLKVKDLVPLLSWFLLKGKCGYCGVKISARYPFVEGLTGFLFALAYWQLGLNWRLIFILLFTAYGVVVAFIDYDHKKIHNFSVLMGSVLALVYQGVMSVSAHDVSVFTNALIGGVVGFFIMLLLAILSRKWFGQNGMGFGDVKIFFAVGLFLGIDAIALGIWLTFLLAGGIAIFYKMTHFNKKENVNLPLGPMILSSTYILLCFVL